MISRQFRFHGLNALTPVYRRSQMARGPLMSLRYAARTTPPDYRAAVVVSRKVHKSAVVRNRIRRRLFETLRRQKQLAHQDLIITVFSDQLASLPPPQLEKQLAALLKKASQPGSAAAPRGIVTTKRKP